MVVRVSAKTMPGKSLGVERELRWRIKRALDRRGIESVDDESLALEAVRAQSGTDHVASADGTDSRAVPLQKAQKK